MFTDFAELIELWSIRVIAEDVGVPYGTAKKWKKRKSIPAVYWPSLLRAAERRGIQHVTLESLVALTQARGETVNGRVYEPEQSPAAVSARRTDRRGKAV